MLFSLSLSLSLFYFHNGRQVRSARVPSFYQRNKKMCSNVERMRLENEKREKRKQKRETTMEIKTRSTVDGDKERKEREEDGGEFWASRGEVHPRRYRSILARRTLSSYLVFNDLSTHQIPQILSLSSNSPSVIFPRGSVSLAVPRACHALQKAIVRAIFSRRSPLA